MKARDQADTLLTTKKVTEEHNARFGLASTERAITSRLRHLSTPGHSAYLRRLSFPDERVTAVSLSATRVGCRRPIPSRRGKSSNRVTWSHVGKPSDETTRYCHTQTSAISASTWGR